MTTQLCLQTIPLVEMFQEERITKLLKMIEIIVALNVRTFEKLVLVSYNWFTFLG